MIRRLLSTFRRRFLGEALWKFGADGGAASAEALRLSVKTLGYHLARELAKTRLASPDLSGQPGADRLGCKPTTQADIESPWFAFWCRELQIAPLYHRKLWEYAFLLQNLHASGKLHEGATGLGFGCGEEPIPSYLAARGISVTVTDLDPVASRGKGWMETGQHTSAIDLVFKPELVARERFNRLVSLRYVDMNEIPADLEGRYDFCWSICALEHLGSIESGLRFVERSMATLKPGGMAVHTTEFNYSCDDGTLESASISLFQRKHFSALARRLEAAGHLIAPLDFDVGTGVLDQFVDVPPYGSGRDMNLKLAVGEFPSTCFGLVVEKRR
jgi:hypothetical protein